VLIFGGSHSELLAPLPEVIEILEEFPAGEALTSHRIEIPHQPLPF
jgi:hypothetical protein